MCAYGALWFSGGYSLVSRKAFKTGTTCKNSLTTFGGLSAAGSELFFEGEGNMALPHFNPDDDQPVHEGMAARDRVLMACFFACLLLILCNS